MKNILYILVIWNSLSSNPFADIKFHGTKETLEKIAEIITRKEKGAYFRFGDGDINLVTGQNDMLQNANNRLRQEMQEAFALNGPTILKTLPLHCKELKTVEPGMFPGNHEATLEQCISFINRIKPYWNGSMTDVYSLVALHHTAAQNPERCIRFLKFLKHSHCVLFIGNQNIPAPIREMLFGPNCIFIPTPSEQSYREIDRIEKDCLAKIKNDGKYKIIVTAMGCSGRALQKRLWHKLDNVFLFDFGSLMDALCGWASRAWIEVTHFDAQKFIELYKSYHPKKKVAPQLRLLYTAALIDQDYESRKREYIKSLEILKGYGINNPYIVEAIKPGPPTFFDNYSTHVVYSNVNDAQLRNKGVNEAKSIQEAFKRFKFNPDDIILKLTGRYYFTSPLLLETIKNHPEVDAFIKKDEYGQVITGCFALRYKFFKEMVNKLDYLNMERKMINLERKVADYLTTIAKKNKAKIMELDTINVIGNIFGTGEYGLAIW